MSTIDIPDSWTHFWSNWDPYRQVYESFCLVDLWWYKALGPTRQSSLEALAHNVSIGRHVKKEEPSRYIKEPTPRRAVNPALLDIGDLDL